MSKDKIIDYLFKIVGAICFFMFVHMFNSIIEKKENISEINRKISVIKEAQKNYVDFKIDIKNNDNKIENYIENNKEKIVENRERIIIVEQVIKLDN